MTLWIGLCMQSDMFRISHVQVMCMCKNTSFDCSGLLEFSILSQYTYNSFGWSPSDPLDPVSAERMTGRCGVAVAEKIAAVVSDTLTRHRQKLLHG